MPEMNIFDDPAFGLAEMTARFNEVPPVMGQVGETLDFEEDGVRTTRVMIESVDGTLGIVEPTPRGGPGEVIDHDKRGLRGFEIAHFQRDESVYAEEVQGVRAFGSTSELMQVQQLVDNKMARHHRDFDLTDEFMKFGVINGKVVSGKGHTILDIYREFDLDQPDDIEFDLANAAFKVRLGADDVRISMEDDLLAPSYGSIIAFCGNEFFRKIIEHKEVRETYLNTAAAVELRGTLPDEFNYGGITWKRYRTTAKARAARNNQSFLADDAARVCFRGVPGLYITRFAPGDYWDTVNTPGLPLYVRENRKERNDKAAKFEIQKNPVHLITQPKTLRRLKLKPA